MYFNLKYKVKTNWHWLVLISLAIIFFLGTSAFNYFSQDPDFVKWSSPDETANYAMSKLYGQDKGLSYIEPNNLIASDIIIPRSFRSDNGVVKPVSFLGMVLIYGQLASWLGTAIIPYLTPLFAAIGLIFFYLLIKEWFNKQIALFSAIMLCFFPVYVYYSSRSMFHNVLFVDLLIFGLYFGVLMVKHKLFPPPGSILAEKRLHYLTWLYAGLSGLFIGMAITTRSSELLWLVPLLIIIWLFNLKKIGLVRLFIWLYFLMIALLPIMYWNTILYHAPLNSGYSEVNQSIVSIVDNSENIVSTAVQAEYSQTKIFFKKWIDNIFYFGFKGWHSVKMFYYYFFLMFPWLFWLAGLGLILFLHNYKKTKQHWAYLTSYLAISVILLFYYGSWIFYDNPDPNSFTIGNSYTRYWLPIYLGALPLASLAIISITKIFKSKILINGTRIAIILIICSLSLQFVLVGSDEGLLPTFERNKLTRMQFDKILELTEDNSIIITQYHDKLFFPERKVIVGLFTDDNMNIEYAKLAKQFPVYYYNFTLPDKDFDYLNNSKLKDVGLKIEIIEKITKDFTLYEIRLK
ncbi:MAG: hypothetical protein ABIG10_04065 [bacterium]